MNYFIINVIFQNHLIDLVILNCNLEFIKQYIFGINVKYKKYVSSFCKNKVMYIVFKLQINHGYSLSILVHPL